MMFEIRRGAMLLLCVCAFQFSFAPLDAGEWRFDVRFSETVRKAPFSGRVYLFFGPAQAGASGEPRTGPNWFRPQPFVARDVVDWKPGETLTFSTQEPKGLLTFPADPKSWDAAGRAVQAVARFNPWERNVGTGAGNGFSAVAKAQGDTLEAPQRLDIDQIVAEEKFNDTEWAKLLRVRSKKLSEFSGHDVDVQAAVLLPASYKSQPERRYPVIYSIPGFGGTHFMGRRETPIPEKNREGVEFIRVFLDPSCPLGHHVFADSDNNGPWGTALVSEFIPALDKAYRTIAAPTARFLTGHSSGGWSSLWAQVTWPEVFGGVWSTSPDPVDFRDFQRIDLYRPGENMYVDAKGDRRPLARVGGQPILWYRDFDQMETVLGPGGQLHSFEAVFSPRAKDGRPVPVWNRTTGEVDTRAARHWEKYDIRLVLERRWKTLEPNLAGKLNVIMGDQDTFYLEGACVLLKESLKDLGSDAVVEIQPGKDHGNILTPALFNRIRNEMTEAFLKHHPPAP